MSKNIFEEISDSLPRLPGLPTPDLTPWQDAANDAVRAFQRGDFNPANAIPQIANLDLPTLTFVDAGQNIQNKIDKNGACNVLPGGENTLSFAPGQNTGIRNPDVSMHLEPAPEKVKGHHEQHSSYHGNGDYEVSQTRLPTIPCPPGFDPTEWNAPTTGSIREAVGRNFSNHLDELNMIDGEGKSKKFVENFLKSQKQMIEAMGGHVFRIHDEKMFVDEGNGQGPHWVDLVRDLGHTNQISWLDRGNNFFSPRN